MTDHTKGSFFGRRVGKPLRVGQQGLMDTLLPKLRLDPQSSPLDTLATAFQDCPEFNPATSQIWLEVGFGGAEHLLFEARRLSSTAFIGVEPFTSGMAKALAAIDGEQLQNIRLYDDDAGKLLDWMPEASLDGAYQLYPDPWPKKRHWKRRFINPVNLDRYARVLKPGAIFRFASDIDTYVDWTLMHMRAHPRFQWLDERAQDWRTPWSPWSGTRYEAKALREGRTPRYLDFRRI